MYSAVRYFLLGVVLLCADGTVIQGDDVVNKEAFEALCAMINLTQISLPAEDITEKITRDVARVGAVNLSLAGEGLLRLVKEHNIDRCIETSQVTGKVGCAGYWPYWRASSADKETIEALEGGGVRKEHLQEDALTGIATNAEEAKKIYDNLTKLKKIYNLKAINESINSALYGQTSVPERLTGGHRDRQLACGSPGEQGHSGQKGLSIDLLCVCGHGNRWDNRKKVCCEDCATGTNSAPWKPEEDATQRWAHLKENCAATASAQTSPTLTFPRAREFFLQKLRSHATVSTQGYYFLGGNPGPTRIPCSGEITSPNKACVKYGPAARVQGGDGIGWMKALEELGERYSSLDSVKPQLDELEKRAKFLSANTEGFLKRREQSATKTNLVQSSEAKPTQKLQPQLTGPQLKTQPPSRRNKRTAEPPSVETVTTGKPGNGQPTSAHTTRKGSGTESTDGKTNVSAVTGVFSPAQESNGGEEENTTVGDEVTSRDNVSDVSVPAASVAEISSTTSSGEVGLPAPFGWRLAFAFVV